jgi:hypothetical protein
MHRRVRSRILPGMSKVLSLAAAVALFAVSITAGNLAAEQQQQQQAPQQPPAQPAAQQPQAPPDRNSVQVGVPLGREGGQGRQGGRGQTFGGVGGARAGGPARPAPRNADGRVLLGGASLKEKGVWIGGNLGRRDEQVMQPWTRAIAADRTSHMLEPHTRCKASGVGRPFLTPYGVEFVELPEIKRIYIFDIGGPHTWRTIYMDGRSHPQNLTPTYYGHSIGWWEGDTLVIDTKGYNESFWMDRGASPHTEQLHTLERITRVYQASMRYELTVDDPGAYTKPWTATMNLRWENGTELFEYVCQQQNYAHELMVGDYERVDRTAFTVP